MGLGLQQILEFFAMQKVKMAVGACNTMTALVLKWQRNNIHLRFSNYYFKRNEACGSFLYCVCIQKILAVGG
jgi:hypothetical protein